MPHDAYGHRLEVGDIVYIPAKITEVHATEEYCNITAVTERPMMPGNSPVPICLNAGQVDKIFHRREPPHHSRPLHSDAETAKPALPEGAVDMTKAAEDRAALEVAGQAGTTEQSSGDAGSTGAAA
jgi:hypothetical protein